MMASTAKSAKLRNSLENRVPSCIWIIRHAAFVLQLAHCCSNGNNTDLIHLLLLTLCELGTREIYFKGEVTEAQGH